MLRRLLPRRSVLLFVAAGAACATAPREPRPAAPPEAPPAAEPEALPAGTEGMLVVVERDAETRSWTAEEEERQVVDFRFSPARWDTALCLPDDTQKSLVSESGKLRVGHDGVDESGSHFFISVKAGADAVEAQEAADPAVPFVTTHYAGSDGSPLTAVAYSLPPETEVPARTTDGGTESAAEGARRTNVLRVTKSDEEAIQFVCGYYMPWLASLSGPVLDEDARHFRFQHVSVAVTAPWTEVTRNGAVWTFTFDPGDRTVAAVVATGYEVGDVDIRWLLQQEYYARGFWEDLDLPYDVMSVPDPGIQQLLTSSIRNVWQAREMRDEYPSFRTGPAFSREVYLADAAFLIEAMDLLGREEEARAGIEGLLRRQKEDGSFEDGRACWKENGIMLYLLYRHTLLTGDIGWLEGKWSAVEGTVGAIGALRERARGNPDAAGAGLLPPGVADGGVGGIAAEYNNVYWCLAGLRAAWRAADLVGRKEQAVAWRAEYDDLRAAFEKSTLPRRIDRGMGTYAVPVLLEPNPDVSPVRGQGALCNAAYPGQVFAPSDPLVRGTLDLLDEQEVEGLVLGTGWRDDGIRNDFASSYAHAHLWAGHGEKAADVLYALANHASPLGGWRAEQMPRGQGDDSTGDMPHSRASAEFIRLVRNLVVLERGEELHLLEGMPRAWLKPGSITNFEAVPTDFGPLSFVLYVDRTLREASLLFSLAARTPPSRVVVHLGAWAAEATAPTALPDGWQEMTIQLAD